MHDDFLFSSERSLFHGHFFAVPLMTADTTLPISPSTTSRPGRGGKGSAPIPSPFAAAAANPDSSSTVFPSSDISMMRFSTNAWVSAKLGEESVRRNSSEAEYSAATAARSAYHPAEAGPNPAAVAALARLSPGPAAMHISSASSARSCSVVGTFSGFAWIATADAHVSMTGSSMARRHFMTASRRSREVMPASSSWRRDTSTLSRLSQSSTKCSTSCPVPRGSCPSSAAEYPRSVAAARRAASDHPCAATCFMAADRMRWLRLCDSSSSSRRWRRRASFSSCSASASSSAAEDAAAAVAASFIAASSFAAPASAAKPRLSSAPPPEMEWRCVAAAATTVATCCCSRALPRAPPMAADGSTTGEAAAAYLLMYLVNPRE
mmetsp:Transcript_30491/g.75769  ORF Transcript_30491/g.75769 Transcript_30491/m.75769 type:complete len:379 (+) Transcript_30491:2330-3466(+)